MNLIYVIIGVSVLVGTVGFGVACWSIYTTKRIYGPMPTDSKTDTHYFESCNTEGFPWDYDGWPGGDVIKLKDARKLLEELHDICCVYDDSYYGLPLDEKEKEPINSIIKAVEIFTNKQIKKFFENQKWRKEHGA